MADVEYPAQRFVVSGGGSGGEGDSYCNCTCCNKTWGNCCGCQCVICFCQCCGGGMETFGLSCGDVPCCGFRCCGVKPGKPFNCQCVAAGIKCCGGGVGACSMALCGGVCCGCQLFEPDAPDPAKPQSLQQSPGQETMPSHIYQSVGLSQLSSLKEVLAAKWLSEQWLRQARNILRNSDEALLPGAQGTTAKEQGGQASTGSIPTTIGYQSLGSTAEELAWARAVIQRASELGQVSGSNSATRINDVKQGSLSFYVPFSTRRGRHFWYLCNFVCFSPDYRWSAEQNGDDDKGATF
ncbi:unnamed protein product [Polarella glacialis]|uniref:Uncharacterized protein n=1 Tax=Polarella glacialis TaxID=89957 RepID=A0A813EXL0_POLGL|nr:unnamed protein product [Polarella glacialis]